MLTWLSSSFILFLLFFNRCLFSRCFFSRLFFNWCFCSRCLCLLNWFRLLLFCCFLWLFVWFSGRLGFRRRNFGNMVIGRLGFVLPWRFFSVLHHLFNLASFSFDSFTSLRFLNWGLFNLFFLDRRLRTLINKILSLKNHTQRLNEHLPIPRLQSSRPHTQRHRRAGLSKLP